MEYLDLILSIVSSTIFLTYVSIITIVYGVQKSISESYYRLVEDPKVNPMWFSRVVAGFAFPIFYLGTSWMLPVAAGLICWVAAVPKFKESKMTNIIHWFVAAGGITLGCLSLIIDYGQWELVVTATVISLLLLKFSKKPIWWIEITYYFTILLGRLSINL
jgi:hypothetical protein